jgi:hypothetical protein
MLYPVLHWMEDQGLVEAGWKEAETGRKRKYYRLRSGALAFAANISGTPPSADTPKKIMIPRRAQLGLGGFP